MASSLASYEVALAPSQEQDDDDDDEERAESNKHGLHHARRTLADVDLPEHLADLDGWVEIPGLGWLLEVPAHGRDGIDFWWWHHCPPMMGLPGYSSPRTIDCSSGERHAITGGSLAGGDLTIHGGSGSIPCDKCGLHGFVRGGVWVPA